jgi:hypothetical protein
MKIGNTVAAAGLIASVALFSSPLLAQAPAGGTSGMPAAGSGSSTLQSPPSTGQPGTQAPASAAPLGAASSESMSHEGATAASAGMPTGNDTRNEEQARGLEVKTGRDITAARALGKDVAKAEKQRSLGSMALSKGDQRIALEHFNLAEQELRNSSANNTNASRTDSHAAMTERNPNATNMNPERGSHVAY